MSSVHRLTRSFRTMSAFVYLVNMFVCGAYAFRFRHYLTILVGTMTALLSLVMLFVTTESPEFIMRCLDTKRFQFLFTFRGRYMIDLFVALYMFAMGVFAIVMGALTIILILSIRFIGIRHQEAFNELFRCPADADDDETLGTYDNTYDGATVESGTADR